MNLPIPESLLRSLQASFQAEGKRLCHEMAKILKVPEKELASKLLKKISLQIIDDSDKPLSCLVSERQGLILARCRYPCLLGTSRCFQHQSQTHFVEKEREELIALRRLETVLYEETPLVLWCEEETGNVYTSDYRHVGIYENERLTLWKLETDS